ERYRLCPHAFQCIVSGGALLGYFVLLPLNEPCAQAIRRGEVTSGREITGAYLAPRDANVSALYLSVVCAVNARARITAIDGVIPALRAYYHQHGVRHLFVRAATTAGSRMLERLIGMPFEPDGRIHEVNLSDHEAITSPVPLRYG